MQKHFRSFTSSRAGTLSPLLSACLLKQEHWGKGEVPAQTQRETLPGMPASQQKSGGGNVELGGGGFKEHDFVLSLIRKCIRNKSSGARLREEERRFVTAVM